MREILFRAKRLDNGEWAEGFYVCLNGTEHMIYNGYAETDCGEFYPDYFQIDPETVCEYTGINDVTGNKIFEGDYLKLNEDVKTTFDVKDGFVRYLGGTFYVGGNINTTLSSLYVLADFMFVMRGRVAGNIFDNPELLEEGAK